MTHTYDLNYFCEVEFRSFAYKGREFVLDGAYVVKVWTMGKGVNNSLLKLMLLLLRIHIALRSITFKLKYLSLTY